MDYFSVWEATTHFHPRPSRARSVTETVINSLDTDILTVSGILTPLVD